MRLLIVEDGEVETTLLTALFAGQSSVHIYIANTLARATELLPEANFVVLDLTLPDATPEESVEWLSTCGVPTIVYSSSWDKDIITKAAKAGAVNFLTKGTSADQIIAAVHFALAHEDLLFDKYEQRIAACAELAVRAKQKLLSCGCASTCTKEEHDEKGV